MNYSVLHPLEKIHIKNDIWCLDTFWFDCMWDCWVLLVRRKRIETQEVTILSPFNLSAVCGAMIEMLNNILHTFQEWTTTDTLTEYLPSIEVIFHEKPSPISAMRISVWHTVYQTDCWWRISHVCGGVVEADAICKCCCLQWNPWLWIFMGEWQSRASGERMKWGVWTRTVETCIKSSCGQVIVNRGFMIWFDFIKFLCFIIEILSLFNSVLSNLIILDQGCIYLIKNTVILWNIITEYNVSFLFQYNLQCNFWPLIPVIGVHFSKLRFIHHLKVEYISNSIDVLG